MTRRLLLALALLVPARALAQAAAAPSAPAPVIDTIVVRGRNIYESDSARPPLLGRVVDALHVRTRDRTTRRLLPIRPGDAADSARIAEGERALRAAGIFTDARVRLDSTARAGGAPPARAVVVETRDGWSTKPQFEYRGAGGSATWLVALQEENLLGAAVGFNVWYGRDPDRSTLAFAYRNPVVSSLRARLALEYAQLSDGERAFASFGVPFLAATSRASAILDGFVADDRVVRWRQGVRDGAFDRRVAMVRGEAGWALRTSTRGYLRAWARAAGGRYDAVPEGAERTHTFTTAFGAGIEAAALRYAVLDGVNAFARREDVDLSRRLRAGLWAVPASRGGTAPGGGIGAELSARFGSGGERGVYTVQAAGHGVFTDHGLDSGRVSVAATLLARALPAQTLIVHGYAAAAADPAPGTEYDLWVSRAGPRLFGAHAFTGTRVTWVAVEHRIILAHELFGLVGLGAAPFVEWGTAHYDDDPARARGDAGLALRIGSTRTVRGDIVEIAGGWQWAEGVEAGRWAVSVGMARRYF